MSGSPQPNYKLLAQAGARVEYDEGRGVFVPTDLPDHVEAVGAVTGDVGEPAVPSPILDHRGDKCFVCFCEDQTTKDLKYAIAEGFDSIELSKRYTTVTMGPCQGRLCHTNSIRVYAKTTGIDENTIGTTTARPPYTPISMGLLAGPPQEPRKRTSLHHRHKDMGGTMMWTGAWRRPHSYGPDAGAEAQHVHQALGLIDVSTLGKILVTGPDAGAFLDRVYPNRFSDLKVGRTRYGVLTGDAGRIMDDGVVARIDDDTFYVSATSTGADGVYQWFTWWNAVWFMDVQFANLTGALAAINVAGPNAREAMQRVSDDDFSAEGFAYLDAKQVTVAGVPTLALRIGFVGELGYELHFPSPLAEHVWDTIFAKARRPRAEAVRPRAAADPPAREGPRDRRPGHRLGVEPARGRDAVARQERQGVRVGRQVGDAAGRRPRPPLDARRLREPVRRDPGRGRPGRDRRQVVRPRDERAAQRRARQGDRPRDRPERARRRRRPLRRPGRTAAPCR